jgi:hypothetical protein
VATRRKYFLTNVIYFLKTVIEGSQAKLHTKPKQNNTRLVKRVIADR